MGNNFSRNLCALRINAGKTQEKMSDLLGLKRSAYSAYEEGRNATFLDLLIKIHTTHNVSLDELILGKIIPNEKSKNRGMSFHEKSDRRKNIIYKAE